MAKRNLRPRQLCCRSMSRVGGTISELLVSPCGWSQWAGLVSARVRGRGERVFKIDRPARIDDGSRLKPPDFPI